MRLILLGVFLVIFNPLSLPAADKLGKTSLPIKKEWTIAVVNSSHPAIIRAARDLQEFLRERRSLQVGISENSKGPGFRLAINEKMKEDGFSLSADKNKNQILIEGPSPRSVYQGVIFLEDYLAENLEFPADTLITVSFPFRERYDIWDCLLAGQNKDAIGFDLESHMREAVRLGYSGIACNRFVGKDLIQPGNAGDPYPWYTYWGPSMDQFVSSPLFEGVYPEKYLERNLADLKHVVKVAESFGLKPIFMGYEPRYVPNDFFLRRPDLRGPRVDHPLRSRTNRYSLCIDRPEVLEHYRTLSLRLGKEVPELREMHIIIHDSGSGICWYDKLYSGRNGPAYCKDIPMGERMRKFFAAIGQGFKDSGRDVKIVVQPHGISRRDIDSFFSSVPAEIDFTAGNWASWSISFGDPLGVDRYVMKLQRETGRRTLYYQQHFFGFDMAPISEFPLPYILVERLNRARGLGLDALNTLGGFVSPPVKDKSVMQETYRQFLFEPDSPAETLVRKVAASLGGDKGGALLEEIWKNIHASFEKNRRIGFALSTEFACRRTLVRPLVPESSALSPEEQDWWLDYTFGGRMGFGHAHLFRGERGTPTDEWYIGSRDHAQRTSETFLGGASKLREFLMENPSAAQKHPYLERHERQLRFLGYLYATGANLYEGQRILDRYNSKNIEDGLKQVVDKDLMKFNSVVENEIQNTANFIRLIEEGGEFGMVLLPEETTWGYSTNLTVLLRRKIEIMRNHLPEAKEVLSRWFNSEY